MKSVAVIGGGIAGLTAAVELVRRGARVSVFEAKSEPGGRVRTFYLGSKPVELGAEFIHAQNIHLLRSLAAAGLAVHQISDDHVLFDEGKLRSVKLWEKADQVIRGANLNEPNVSFAALLQQHHHSDFDRKAARSLVEGFDAAHTDRISVHSLRRAHYSYEKMKGSWQGRVDKGYTSLINHLADEIRQGGGTIQTDSPVQSVKWTANQVNLDGPGFESGHNNSFDKAIITVPLGAWKRKAITFFPRLPEKERAVELMEFGNVVKVILVFRERWWPPAFNGFVHDFDAPFPTFWTSPDSLQWTAWAGGPKADALLASPNHLETRAMDALAQIFSMDPAIVRGHLAQAFFHNWAADPYIGGAYSYIPVNGLDLPKLLAAPVADTLFFAGEATVFDAQTGTVFGALETGLRAAREVMGQEPILQNL